MVLINPPDLEDAQVMFNEVPTELALREQGLYQLRI